MLREQQKNLPSILARVRQPSPLSERRPEWVVLLDCGWHRRPAMRKRVHPWFRCWTWIRERLLKLRRRIKGWSFEFGIQGYALGFWIEDVCHHSCSGIRSNRRRIGSVGRAHSTAAPVACSF